SLTSAVIESLTAKFSKRREAKHTEFRKVNGVASALRDQTHRIIDNAFGELKKSVSAIAIPDVFYTDGGPDKGNEYWYKSEVNQSARESGKFVNFNEDHYFVKGSIRVDRERLVFVTSFHHVGRELSGIMEATAFSQFESFEDSDDRKSV